MKIFFFSDILRHPIDNQPTDHSWLLNLWFNDENYDLSKISDFHIPNNIKTILPKEPYSNVNEEDIPTISNYIKDEITSKHDIIIAFECTERTRKIVSELHSKVLFVYFSPLRYCNRQTFSLSSNNLEFQSKIDSIYKKATTYYKQEANYVKELINNNYPELDYPKDSILLVGQVEKDLSVWNGNKFVNLDDYLDVILEKYKNENVSFLYKAHPLSKENNPKVISHPNIRCIDDNIYRILSSTSISCVITISSSVAKEASFFGKKTKEYLHSYIPNESKSIPYLMENFFWQFLFNDTTIENAHFSMIDRRDIRPTRNLYWGYKSILELASIHKDNFHIINENINGVKNEMETQNDQLRKKLDQVLLQNSALQKQLIQLANKRAELERGFNKSEQELSKLLNQLSEIKQQQIRYQIKSQEFSNQVKELEKRDLIYLITVFLKKLIRQP